MENATEANDFVENPLGDFAFAHFRQGQVAPVAREERYNVGVLIKARAFRGNVVGDNQVGVFGQKLLAGIFRHMPGFSGKPNDDSVSFVLGHFREDVRGLLERDD